MSRKREEDYEYVIERLPFTINVERVMVDFEKAAINAMQAKFDEWDLNIIVISTSCFIQYFCLD